MALKQVEDELGGPLLETDRKRDLTDLGRFVRDISEDLVREHDNAISLIQGYAKGRVGRLRIASVPSVAALILPDLLSAFMDAHEGVQVDLMDSDSSNVSAMVASGIADLGIAGPAAQSRSLRDGPHARQLPCQCCRGKLLAASKARTDPLPHLLNPRSCTAGRFRVHRDVLQPETQAPEHRNAVTR